MVVSQRPYMRSATGSESAASRAGGKHRLGCQSMEGRKRELEGTRGGSGQEFLVLDRQNEPPGGLIYERMGDPSASDSFGGRGGRYDDAMRQLASIYDAYAEGLFRYAVMILADPAAAEDAVHQAFLKLMARTGRLDEIKKANAYLYRAVRNECYRLLKRRSRRDPAAATALLEANCADRSEDTEDLRQALEQALGALPAKQREVVHMKVYEKMTFKQIADRLAVSINTAASRYRYALSRLRE